MQTYQTYFKREFDKKRENGGVLARFVLFLAGMPDNVIVRIRHFTTFLDETRPKSPLFYTFRVLFRRRKMV